MPTATTTLAPPAEPERLWPARIYPGTLDQAAHVRKDLHTDLAAFGTELAETVALCASEAFANAAEHTRSGEPGGHVVRALYTPSPGLLRLAIVDDGAKDTHPHIPRQRTPEQWDTAETGRGLLLIDTLAAAWGTYPIVPFPFCAGLGTAVWAEFPLPGEQAQPAAR